MKVELQKINGYEAYLTDESGLVVGNAEGIYFPTTEEEVVWIIKAAISQQKTVTISGGGTGLTGGRAPLGGWILATDKLRTVGGSVDSWRDENTGIDYSYKFDKEAITVPVSMPLVSLQKLCRIKGRYYPPDPTEKTSFIGGNVATNASGSRSFKYGPTRSWVKSLRVTLPTGESIAINRGDGKLGGDKHLVINTKFHRYMIPIPTYNQPKVRKNTAGPVLDKNSEIIDLFIGTGGIFGIITEVTLRTIELPDNIMNIFIYCDNRQAMQLVSICQENRREDKNPIPLSVEYLDGQAVKMMRAKDNSIPEVECLIILEQDFRDEEQDKFVEFWLEKFKELGIDHTSVAQSAKEIDHHKDLRHTVPETVNALVREYGQSKLGTDYSVPDIYFEELLEKIVRTGELFEKRYDLDPGYALWAHAGDSHFHLNFLPRDRDQSMAAKELMIELMKHVVESGGSISAEHGLGKKKFVGKPAIIYQYGDEVIGELLAMRRVMDPQLLLNRGNLTGITDS